MKKRLGAALEGLLLLCLERGELLHQAALAAGGVALVDRATRGGLVKVTDGDLGRHLGRGNIRLARVDRGARLLDERAGAIAEGAVEDATLLILTIALQRRCVIGHVPS